MTSSLGLDFERSIQWTKFANSEARPLASPRALKSQEQGLEQMCNERDRPLEGVALWPNQTKGAISEPGLGGLPTEGTPQDSGQRDTLGPTCADGTGPGSALGIQEGMHRGPETRTMSRSRLSPEAHRCGGRHV